jgi:hypothetical protein
MNALLKAFKDRITQDTVTGALAGGVHWGTATALREMPFIILTTLPSFGQEENTGDTFTEYQPLRCATYAYSAAEAAKICARLETLFHARTLPLVVGRMLHCHKGSDSLMQDPERDDAGQEIWQAIIDFNFLVQHNPGD